MDDRNFAVSLYHALAWGTWIIAFTGVLLGWLLHALHISSVGLVFSALAATLTIRCYVSRLNVSIRAAFDLGRETGRADVRPLGRA